MSKNILLDLDGTLINPQLGITNCMVHALARIGARVPPHDEMVATIGPPLRLAFQQFLPHANPAEIERAVALYRERYSAGGLFECEVYDGIPDMLKRLAGRGFRLILATSKPHVYAKRILEHFALDDYFFAIHGSELDGRNDRKSDLIAHILNTHGVMPTDAVMIGDRGVDISGARANGVDGIGALWGYGSRGKLEEAGAVTIIGQQAEILDVFDLRQRLKTQ